MIVLHGIWTGSALCVWGERHPGSDAGARSVQADLRHGTDEADTFAASSDGLRSRLGDVFDTLLISQAQDAELALRLPHVEQRVLHSWPGSLSHESEGAAIRLLRRSVPALSLEPADALDLLCADVRLPDLVGQVGGAPSLCVAPSWRYWQKAAWLGRELLARQQFVPAAHRTRDNRVLGYWRALVDDPGVARRLRGLIASMPPVCRALVSEHPSEEGEPASLVETFLWKAVDGVVRRCVASDELTHAIREGNGAQVSLQMRWLRSLVDADAQVAGTPAECAEVYERVQNWIARLEPPRPDRIFTTCFRLEPPQIDAGESVPYWQRTWRLGIELQSRSRASVSVGVDQLFDSRREELRIFGQPVEQARHQLRGDLQQAARHFAPLAAALEHELPSQIELSLDDAYTFLRDAAPLLRNEEFSVELPKWWRESAPRVGLRLDIRPAEGGGESYEPSQMGLEALVDYNWRIAIGDEDLSEEELSGLAASRLPLVRLRGRWLEVQPADVQTALAFLSQNRSGRSTVFETLRRVYACDDQMTGLPVTSLRSHGWLRRLFDDPGQTQQYQNVRQPTAFTGTLRPYQLRGVGWLAFLSRLGIGGCLADDMGLGKTIQLIGMLLHEREDGQSPGPTLLIVPTSLVGNWHRELARFAPTLRVVIHHGLERRTGKAFVEEAAEADVVICTYALTYRDFDHLSAVQWHRVALDEAQNIKNPAAKQSVATRSFKTVHRVALTGTPVENRLSELWSIMDFLNPGFLGSAADFRRRFAVPIERYRESDPGRRLRHLIRPFVLRRTKDDPQVEVDLPEKMEMKVYCNLTREQAGLYETVLNDMLGQIDNSGGIQRRGLILATLVRLKQICNHPAQFHGDGSPVPHRSGKSDRLAEMLEEVVAEGHGALVFTQFREMGNLLKTFLAETLRVEVLFLHGGSTPRQRDEMIQRFQAARGDTPIFILSLRAGGFGLNLTAANHVFHFDRWWNPAVEDQATDRVHRLGQTRRVQVHKFICIGTLEERVDVLLENKRHLADAIVGAGEDWLTELSTDQLRDLFTLSRDAVMGD